MENYRVGDKVLLYTPVVPRGVSKKLCIRWHGPYVIATPRTGKRYLIGATRKDGEFKNVWVHETRLKKYHESSTDQVNADDISDEVLTDPIMQPALAEPVGKESTDAEMDPRAWVTLWNRGDLPEGTYQQTDHGRALRHINPGDSECPAERDEEITERYALTRCSECKGWKQGRVLCSECFTNSDNHCSLQEYPYHKASIVGHDSESGANCCNPECAKKCKQIECLCPHETASEVVDTWTLDNPVLTGAGRNRPDAACRSHRYDSGSKLPKDSEVPAINKNEQLTQLPRDDTETGAEDELHVVAITNMVDGLDSQHMYKYTVDWGAYYSDERFTNERVLNVLGALNKVSQYWDSSQGMSKWIKLRPSNGSQQQWCNRLFQDGVMKAEQAEVAAVILHTLDADSMTAGLERLSMEGLRDTDIVHLILAVKDKRRHKKAKNQQKTGYFPYPLIKQSWSKAKEVLMESERERVVEEFRNTSDHPATGAWTNDKYQVHHVFGNSKKIWGTTVAAETQHAVTTECSIIHQPVQVQVVQADPTAPEHTSVQQSAHAQVQVQSRETDAAATGTQHATVAGSPENCQPAQVQVAQTDAAASEAQCATAAESPEVHQAAQVQTEQHEVCSAQDAECTKSELKSNPRSDFVQEDHRTEALPQDCPNALQADQKEWPGSERSMPRQMDNWDQATQEGQHESSGAPSAACTKSELRSNPRSDFVQEDPRTETLSRGYHKVLRETAEEWSSDKRRLTRVMDRMDMLASKGAHGEELTEVLQDMHERHSSSVEFKNAREAQLLDTVSQHAVAMKATMECSAAVVGRLLEHNERVLEHSAALVKAAMGHGAAIAEEAMDSSVVKRSLDYCDVQMETLRTQKRLRPGKNKDTLPHACTR